MRQPKQDRQQVNKKSKTHNTQKASRNPGCFLDVRGREAQGHNSKHSKAQNAFFCASPYACRLSATRLRFSLVHDIVFSDFILIDLVDVVVLHFVIGGHFAVGVFTVVYFPALGGIL